MDQSNLNEAYLQPWKSFTAKVFVQTAPPFFLGPEPGFAHSQTDKFLPVAIDPGQETNTNEIYVKPVDNTNKGKPVVGVLAECFHHVNVPHKVITQGIVPMRLSQQTNAGADVEVKPGDMVCFFSGSEPNISRRGIGKATTGHWAFGIALTEGKITKNQMAATDTPWVAVLLCRGRKVA